MGKIGALSGGPGGPFGIGDGPGIGIGKRSARGQGGVAPCRTRRSASRRSRSYCTPKSLSIQKTRASARYQGTLLLAIDVDVNGRVTNVRVDAKPGHGARRKSHGGGDEVEVPAGDGWRSAGDRAGPGQVTFHLL